MYSYIKGKLVEMQNGVAVVETNGIGYDLMVSNETASSLTIDSEVKLFCHLVAKEEAVNLFGFLEKAEKDMFLRLVSISGVGPKTALGVLSGMNAATLAAAIVSEDTLGLSRIKGIGKRTAERIVLELKEKLKEEFSAIKECEHTHTVFSAGTAQAEAIAALISLGYKAQEAQKAVAKVAKSEKMTVEEIILVALRGS